MALRPCPGIATSSVASSRGENDRRPSSKRVARQSTKTSEVEEGLAHDLDVHSHDLVCGVAPLGRILVLSCGRWAPESCVRRRLWKVQIQTAHDHLSTEKCQTSQSNKAQQPPTLPQQQPVSHESPQSPSQNNACPQPEHLAGLNAWAESMSSLHIQTQINPVESAHYRRDAQNQSKPNPNPAVTKWVKQTSGVLIKTAFLGTGTATCWS